MTDTYLIEIFCIIDEFCKYFAPELKNIRWSPPVNAATTAHVSCPRVR